MPSPVTRRTILTAAAFAAGVPRLALADAGAPPEQAFADLERQSGGRLGVAVLDTGGGTRFNYRAAERFLMCSTFKALLAGFVLKRIDDGAERLDRRIAVKPSDIISHSPVSEKHIGGAGMTVAELCQAIVTQSDNGAANILLDSVGGPPALTGFVRSLGDAATRLDRTELALNLADPANPDFDTTTPAAMLGTWHRLLLEPTLSDSSRKQVVAWLRDNQTGDARLRAGLTGWIVGDKTGTGGQGQTNDIAIAWPPDQAPVLIAVFYQAAGTNDEANSAVIAQVGRIVVAAL